MQQKINTNHTGVNLLISQKRLKSCYIVGAKNLAEDAVNAKMLTLFALNFANAMEAVVRH